MSLTAEPYYTVYELGDIETGVCPPFEIHYFYDGGGEYELILRDYRRGQDQCLGRFPNLAQAVEAASAVDVDAALAELDARLEAERGTGAA